MIFIFDLWTTRTFSEVIVDVFCKINTLQTDTLHLHRSCGKDVPIIVCGQKYNDDAQENEATLVAKTLVHCRRRGFQYFNVILNQDYSTRQPFLWLARKFSGDCDLQLSKDCDIPKFLHSASLVDICRAKVVDIVSSTEHISKDNIIDVMVCADDQDEHIILQACFESIKKNGMYSDREFIVSLAESTKSRPRLWKQVVDILFVAPSHDDIDNDDSNCVFYA